ncbi:MAG: YbbR-like domain-containing protein [Bdellovibrionales bacterium]|nr:YbbR-like domain-containing protein [Bdellovibrionales bacterium]
MRDRGLLTIALLIAIGLAVFVHSDSNTVFQKIVVPIEVKNLGQDRVLLWSDVDEVFVSLRGPAFHMSRIYESRPTFQVSLPSEAYRRYRTALRAEDLNLPPSVQVERIEPAYVELEIDNIVEENLQVDVAVLGKVPEGYQLNSIKVTPSSVKVRGAESELKEVSSIATVPLDLRKARADVVRDVNLRVPGKFSSAEPSKVEVSLSISPIQKEKSFKSLQIMIRDPASLALKPSPDRVSLEVQGPQTVVDQLSADNLAVYLQLSPDSKAGDLVEVQVELPSGISALLVEPQKVKLLKK